MSKNFPKIANIRLSDEQWTFLEYVAQETKRDKSEIVRIAIDMLKSTVELGVTCRLVKCPHAGEVIVKKP